MRQRFLKEFDSLWFDCMNGDSRETGKLTPTASRTPAFSPPNTIGKAFDWAAISLMVRKSGKRTKPKVHFKRLWARRHAEFSRAVSHGRFNSATLHPTKEEPAFFSVDRERSYPAMATPWRCHESHQADFQEMHLRFWFSCQICAQSS